MKENETKEVAIREGQEEQTGVTLFGTTNPVAIIAKADAIAKPLRHKIESLKLYTRINNRKFVRVEGWTLLGSLVGVFPVLEWTQKLENGYSARVVAKTLSGQVIGAAEAECTRAEKNWATRDDYALKSMAQTRATSKALRIPLGFIMALGGYETTPAEEVTEEILKDHPTDKPPTAPPQQKTSAPPREKLLFDIEGIVAEFKQKDGEKNGKKWTLTTIKMESGIELKTFDTNFAKILYDAQRRMIPVKITSDTENIIQSVDPVRQPGED